MSAHTFDETLVVPATVRLMEAYYFLRQTSILNPDLYLERAQTFRTEATKYVSIHRNWNGYGNVINLEEENYDNGLPDGWLQPDPNTTEDENLMLELYRAMSFLYLLAPNLGIARAWVQVEDVMAKITKKYDKYIIC